MQNKKRENHKKVEEVEGASRSKMGKLELWWGSELVLRTYLSGSHCTFSVPVAQGCVAPQYASVI